MCANDEVATHESLEAKQVTYTYYRYLLYFPSHRETSTYFLSPIGFLKYQRQEDSLVALGTKVGPTCVLQSNGPHQLTANHILKFLEKQKTLFRK